MYTYTDEAWHGVLAIRLRSEKQTDKCAWAMDIAIFLVIFMVIFMVMVVVMVLA